MGHGRWGRIEILHKGCISSERGVCPGEARQQQRAPGAERGAKERWAGARLWPSCPGIRLPLRSGREVGGLRSEVRSKPHFDSQLVHWLSDLQPRINSRTRPTWEMGQCFPGFSTQNPLGREAKTSISKESQAEQSKAIHVTPHFFKALGFSFQLHRTFALYSKTN